MNAHHDPALFLLNAPVAVIGVAHGGRTAGLTAAWLSRVSTSPPLLLVAVAPERHTWGVLDAAEGFSVSILRDGDLETGRLFGLNSGRDVDKWGRVEHVLTADGSPALTRCAARLSCRTTSRLPTGDHEIFVGEVVASEVVDGGPALPMRGADWAP